MPATAHDTPAAQASAPAVAAPAARGAGPALGPAGLLALQRSAGNRAVGRALARACEQGQVGPSADEAHDVKSLVVSVTLRAATSGYPGVTFTFTNQNCRVLEGYKMAGEPGQASTDVADALGEDVNVAMRWVFETPGTYELELGRDAQGKLALLRYEQTAKLANARTPGVASTKAASNVVYVIGSPSPGQAYPLQFVNAALQHKQDEAVWFVEKTGYELNKTPLTDITAKAPGGRVTWITPDNPLAEQLNKLPVGSVRALVLYSHGLDGIATLRYGWGDKGKDYGLDRSDARKVDGGVFSEKAFLDLESCQGGTNLEGGSLAQVLADRTHRHVTAWTGRTSYADVNSGKGGVRGSEYGFSTDALREFYVRNWVAGASPERKDFAPK